MQYNTPSSKGEKSWRGSENTHNYWPNRQMRHRNYQWTYEEETLIAFVYAVAFTDKLGPSNNKTFVSSSVASFTQSWQWGQWHVIPEEKRSQSNSQLSSDVTHCMLINVNSTSANHLKDCGWWQRMHIVTYKYHTFAITFCAQRTVLVKMVSVKVPFLVILVALLIFVHQGDAWRRRRRRRCPVRDCEVSSWSSWSSCSAWKCGQQGSQSRSRWVKSSSSCGGAQCPDLYETRSCYASRAVDCELSSWSEWSACTTRCGVSGTQHSSRHRIVTEECGGTCSSTFRKTRACPDLSCLNGGSLKDGLCLCKEGYSGQCCEKGGENENGKGKWFIPNVYASIPYCSRCKCLKVSSTLFAWIYFKYYSSCFLDLSLLLLSMLQWWVGIRIKHWLI